MKKHGPADEVMVSSISWSQAHAAEEEEEEGGTWEEIGVGGLWCLDLRSFSTTSPVNVSLSPWKSATTHDVSPPPSGLEEAAQVFLETLNESVRRRVASAPLPKADESSSHAPARVAVLYR